MQLKHIYTGNVGYFIKEYKPTGRASTTQIKMDDGRIYFAPSIEFKTVSLKDNKNRKWLI